MSKTFWTFITVLLTFLLGVSVTTYYGVYQVNKLLEMEREQISVIHQYMKGERVLVIGDENIRIEVEGIDGP